MLSHRESNTQQVAALDPLAAGLGLRPGLGVAEARAMHPQIEVVEADPAADRRLLESLADWCDRYTPLVALDGVDGLFLDITGCTHLFGGERALLDDILARLEQQGFDARATIASTPGAAWAGARHAPGTVLAAGDEAQSVAALPPAALRLEPDSCAGLESVGLRTVAALMTIARAPLVRRFGKGVALRIDQALGHVEEAISPRLAVPALIVERHFAEPIGRMEDIEELVLALARQLRAELERRAEGAERLQLQLFRVDGAVSRISVALSRPQRDPRLIQKLFHERLERAGSDLDAGYGFDLVRLAVLSTNRIEEAQALLDGGEADRGGELAHFADRLRARLGEAVLAIPEIAGSHWPERAARLKPVAQAPDRTKSVEGWPSRPIRLFVMPERVEVTAAEIPEGPPGRFNWRKVSYRIANAEGPERIAPEWWRSEGEKARDYFRVEDETGRRYWLFREGRYGEAEPPRWYMQGLFA